MTHSHRNGKITKRFRPFSYQPGTDGVDDTFDIVCRETGNVVAAFHYWEERAKAKRGARHFAAALNALYRNGGNLHLSGLINAHHYLYSRYCGFVIVTGGSDTTESGNNGGSGEPTNIDRAAWAKTALACFTAQTSGDYHPELMNRDDLECAIVDLIADLMHFASQQGCNVGTFLQRASDHFVAELGTGGANP